MLVCGRRRVVMPSRANPCLECARRELREETEYDCADLRFLMSFDATVEAEPAQQLTIFGAGTTEPSPLPAMRGRHWLLSGVPTQRIINPGICYRNLGCRACGCQRNYRRDTSLTMSSYTIPYSALATEVSLVKTELMRAVENVLDSGRYVLGPEVAAFEREFAEYCQTKFAAGVANGTCALHLVLRGIGLKEGDEVVTAPNSFIASASSIALAGQSQSLWISATTGI